MSDVMAIDIETENFSHEIGGWGNTHMFPSHDHNHLWQCVLQCPGRELRGTVP